MKDSELSNLAASVHQRLLNLARSTGRPFNELLQYFAMERFLYRLSVSPLAPRLILKGALMFSAWRAPLSRPTRDIDLLGLIPNRVEDVERAIRTICDQEVTQDGMAFLADTVASEAITTQARYAGIRVRLLAMLGHARLHMQLDIGFGDPAPRGETWSELPTLLDFPAPTLLGIPRENAIAEKLHAMASLGMLNTRLKDYFDIWFLSCHFEFDAAALTAAIEATFASRASDPSSDIAGLRTEYAAEPERQAQWRAFIERSRIEDSPDSLGEVVRSIREFLGPILRGLASGQRPSGRWIPHGPWRSE